MNTWVLITTLCIIVCVAIGKISHAVCNPFWNKQPVFLHTNLSQWFRTGTQVDSMRPNKNDKFYDPSVLVRSINECQENDISLVLKLLEENYSPISTFTYTPSLETFNATFVMSDSSYIATLCGKDGELIGCITSRPAYCRIGHTTIYVNYIDHLCVKRNSRGKGVAPRLITTIASVVREQTGHVPCLFKREGASTPIVPLTCVETTATQAPIGHTELTHNVSKLEPGDAIGLLKNIFGMNKYNCVAYMPPLAIASIIQNGIYNVYRTISGSLFVFRSTEVSSEQPVEECVFSLKSNSANKSDFFSEYCAVIRVHRAGKYIIVLDGTGDNTILLRESEKVSVPLEKGYANYYLYNYIEHPHPCDKVAILI